MEVWNLVIVDTNNWMENKGAYEARDTLGKKRQVLGCPPNLKVGDTIQARVYYTLGDSVTLEFLKLL